MDLWTVFIFVTALHGVVGTSLVDLCNEIVTLDCGQLSFDEHEKACDTDGKVYSNFCYFDQAQCLDDSIVFDTSFSCLRTTTPRPLSTQAPTTPPTSPPTTQTPQTTTTLTHPPIKMTTVPPTTQKPQPTRDMVQQVFCDHKDSISCAHAEQGFVCGTDGTTYINKCELTKVQCDKPSLQILHTGFCAG